MRLVLLHPAVAARDCADCRRWLYDDRPGAFGAKPIERGGKKVARLPGQRTPCSWCEKQPPDVPEADRTPATAQDLSEKNWRAYRHYLECRAVGQFPDDPIVRRTAAEVRQAEDLAALVRQARLAVLSSVPR